MARPYEAQPLNRRYVWARACRERDDAFYPGKFDRDPSRFRAPRYRPRQHATQTWWGGMRFFRTDHWRMADLRAPTHPVKGA